MIGHALEQPLAPRLDAVAAAAEQQLRAWPARAEALAPALAADEHRGAAAPSGDGSGNIPAGPLQARPKGSSGSWNAAVEACGLPLRHPMSLSRDQAVGADNDAHAELGPGLTYATYTAWAKANARPSASVLNRHFGTFNSARKAAGVDPDTPARQQGSR